MQQYLELAEIRAAFRRAGVLRDWASDPEIRSINQSIDVPLAKDYDAIADVEWETRTHRIAVGMNGPSKSFERYRDVVSAIAGEHQVRYGSLSHLFGQPSLSAEGGIRPSAFPGCTGDVAIVLLQFARSATLPDACI